MLNSKVSLERTMIEGMVPEKRDRVDQHEGGHRNERHLGHTSAWGREELS